MHYLPCLDCQNCFCVWQFITQHIRKTDFLVVLLATVRLTTRSLDTTRTCLTITYLDHKCLLFWLRWGLCVKAYVHIQAQEALVQGIDGQFWGMSMLQMQGFAFILPQIGRWDLWIGDVALGIASTISMMTMLPGSPSNILLLLMLSRTKLFYWTWVYCCVWCMQGRFEHL